MKLVRRGSRSGYRYYCCVRFSAWWHQRERQLCDWATTTIIKVKSTLLLSKSTPSTATASGGTQTATLSSSPPPPPPPSTTSESPEIHSNCRYIQHSNPPSQKHHQQQQQPQHFLATTPKSTFLTSKTPIQPQIARPFTTTTSSRMNTPVGSDEALLASSRAFIPSLTNAMHKGQAGRIGVIGGSEEYTGAPYFSAISALKVGADLAHVFCVRPAASVIKTYSPELIVHPYLDNDNAVEAIMEWAPRMHSFVIGPGLGRDPKILDTVTILIEKLKEMEKPLIIDADGLFLITQKLDLVRNYSKVILTPNSVEFSRLCTAVLGEEVKPAPSASAEKVRELAMALGSVTILHKGATDVASNGRLTVCCAGGGSNRRCGGQGDLLAGSLAVLFHWALAFGDRGGAPAPPELLAAYGACRLTRECARLAFSQHGRSTTTTDLVRLIHQAFSFLFGP